MEGLRANGAATSASAQLSAAAAAAAAAAEDDESRSPDSNKVLPPTLPAEERARTVASAAGAGAAACGDTPAPSIAVGVAAAPVGAPGDKARKTSTRYPDTDSNDGSRGVDGSGRTGGGGGRWARDVDVAWLSQQTKGFSGADLSSLVRNAAMVALREEGEGVAKVAARQVTAGGSAGGRGLLMLARRHFETALASTEPSSGPEAVAKHERWARQWHVAS